MNKNEEVEMFYEYIKTHKHLDGNGWLDLEAFCVRLSQCFAADDILHLSPQPRDMYDFLIAMIYDWAKENERPIEELESWIKVYPINNWTPEMAIAYPDKVATLIHPSALLYVMPHWIYGIGHDLMELPILEEGLYHAWAKPEWTFVHTFINGLHDQFFGFMKEFDRQGAKEKGVTGFETLHNALTNDIPYEQAQANLLDRHTAQQEGLTKINEAISAEFYLEAVALEESIIRNCLYQYCHAKRKGFKDTKFFNLIRESQKSLKKNEEATKLLDQVNEWRKSRNHILHNFITARTAELNSSLNAYAEEAKEAASQGAKLAEEIIGWYHQEAVNFIPTNYAPEKKKLH
ncbi:hypothetical protein [Terasakiella sp. SH-1]|uniref:hypothetical protein n=1 Tax=Terasakiella sp. SH-1 TaxID=2560057 RepID=UPI001072EFFD|nr:hypothetical protein [Terasakiella sp. SH-1]